MNKALKTALILSIITIVYNITEGIISIYFGWSDETLALFGFGVDSFVEVIEYESDKKIRVGERLKCRKQ